MTVPMAKTECEKGGVRVCLVGVERGGEGVERWELCRLNDLRAASRDERRQQGGIVWSGWGGRLGGSPYDYAASG